MSFFMIPLFIILFLTKSFTLLAISEENISHINIENSISTKLNEDSKILVLVFSGQGLGVGIPIYEFQKTFSDASFNMIFIRDLQKKFYQYGITPKGNISSAFLTIKEEIRSIDPEKIIVIGNSSGGYASLLFGYLLLSENFPITKVIAFAPRFAGQEFKNEFKDYPYIETRYTSLKKVFKNSIVKDNIFHIYYAKDCPIDYNYAFNYLSFPWIEHHVYEEGGHLLIRVLRDEGILSQILDEAMRE